MTEGAGTSGAAGILGLLKVLNLERGDFTLKVMCDGRLVTVEVTADGAGLVSHVGTALSGQVANTLGLTGALSGGLAGLKRRRRGHDPGVVVRDLAVMLADGGECVSDLAVVREQETLFGSVASDSTAFRWSRRSPQRRAWWTRFGVRTRSPGSGSGSCTAPERLTIDIDATLITSHSEKENAAGTYKHGYGFHPLGGWADETREALAIVLRPGNAGSNTAADHITVIDRSLAQIPDAHLEDLEILIRADRAGATVVGQFESVERGCRR